MVMTLSVHVRAISNHIKHHTYRQRESVCVREKQEGERERERERHVNPAILLFCSSLQFIRCC